MEKYYFTKMKKIYNNRQNYRIILPKQLSSEIGTEESIDVAIKLEGRTLIVILNPKIEVS